MTIENTKAPSGAGKIYLTPRDVIAGSPSGRTTVYAALRCGVLRSSRVGKRLIILESDMHAWLTANVTVPAQPMPGLEDLQADPPAGRMGCRHRLGRDAVAALADRGRRGAIIDPGWEEIPEDEAA